MKKRMLALVLLLAMLVTVLVSCTDGEDGADGRDGRDGEQGEKGETGAAGADGNGIAKIEKTATDGLLDTYTITYTDGTTTTFTVTNGEDGEDGVQGEKGETGAAGADGNGIAKIEKTATDGLLDTYTITYTDGTTTTFTVTNGEDGEDGEKGDKGDTGEAGEKGDTGATIEKVELNADGELVITLTDGTVLDPVAIPENTHEHTGEWLDWGSNDYLRCHERMYYRSCTVCENVQVKQGTVDDHLFEGDWVCVDESALCPDKIFVRFCAYCDDYEYKQDATHVYETTYSYDENSHWLACENCSAISGRGAHTYVDTACTTCGAAGDPYLSGIDMKRHQYNALVRSQESGNGAFYCEDFWVDPTTGGGDALSFAVIERNERIEDTYNCTIIQKWSTMESMYEEVG
ncbi:MAG: collagen-like protein, partial [Clostridia bacterium]|nr:collagen-like protein [Clostridia bacterium]